LRDGFDSIEVERRSLLLEQIPEDVTSAFDAAESTNIEFGLPWLRNLAATALPPGESAWLYIARTRGSDFVALPLRLNSKNRTIHALSNWYSSIWSPVVHCDQPQAFYKAIFSFIANNERLVSLSLSPIDPEGACFRELQTALQDTRWKGLHTWNCFANWIHPMGHQDYEAYLAGRPSRVRNTIRRKSKGFLEGDAGELIIIDDIRRYPGASSQFLAVYGQSWKPQEPFPAFIPGLLETASERHWLRLGLAIYKGKPVAAQIWLVANGTAAIFKLAYHSAYRSLSPGTVLTAHMMQHVIDIDRITTIDYLTGDDDYKQDWMSVQRERRGIAGYNTITLRGWAGRLSHGLKTLVKKGFAKTRSDLR
jgi:hypothetical protein